ncbi:MAG: hypothetical protein IPP90_10295 [Gemmatimonadaceae bacterium]|nr:hypothetical protein [Gemmatimonadaceae bacterium]
MERLHKDLRELLALFSSNHVEYIVVGGHAVAFHGHPRFTEDLDCYVRPTEENGSRIVRALREFGFASDGLSAADFAADDRMIQLGRAPNRVDLLTRLYAVSFDDAWSTKVGGTIDGVPVWFIDRASLLRNKRATGRPQDLADADFIERLPDHG